MNKIESFKVDHTKLEEGLYVSRKDTKQGVTVTTFDLRMTKPNIAPPIDVPAIHAIEHLVATFLRNSEHSDDVVYFGPMGCRTGFYLLMFGDLCSQDVLPLVKNAMQFVCNFQGEIPGASAVECGNYKELNLTTAKYYAKKYLEDLGKGFFEYR
ncbi:MAG: S-ribosylhomocysteine lyase [Bacillota bacterium]